MKTKKRLPKFKLKMNENSCIQLSSYFFERRIQHSKKFQFKISKLNLNNK